MSATTMPSAHELGEVYEALVRRRRILLTAHVVLGLLAGLAMMSQMNFGAVRYWERRGIGFLLVHLRASWPYVISFALGYRRVVAGSAQLAILLSILVIGTLGGIATYLTAPNDVFSLVPWLQFLLFVVATSVLTKPVGPS
jgi:hypothetical protein